MRSLALAVLLGLPVLAGCGFVTGLKDAAQNKEPATDAPPIEKAGDIVGKAILGVLGGLTIAGIPAGFLLKNAITGLAQSVPASTHEAIAAPDPAPKGTP